MLFIIVSLLRALREINRHYLPLLRMGRYWATDGEHFWVKPRPDPTPLIRGNMTNAEINAKRYMSPGPPVCPKMVIMLCEGRFPPDDMSVRICLTRKRNALKNRLREGEVNSCHLRQ